MKRAGFVVCGLVLLLGVAGPARAGAPAHQVLLDGVEHIADYDVTLQVEDDGDLLIEEVIDYDFGPFERRGIFRDFLVRFHFDDRFDRVYPLEVVSVTTSSGAPDDVEVSSEGNSTRIRIGDPDVTISGRHTYTIVMRVEGALNGFDTHDELFWNAVGGQWQVPIAQTRVRVAMPAQITEAACFVGPEGSRLACESTEVDGRVAEFTNGLQFPNESFTVVAAMPTGEVPAPSPVLDERFSLIRAFAVTPVTAGASGALLLTGLAGVAALLWRRGRDRRFVGSPTDVAFGNDAGTVEPVPLFDRTPNPVEFVPPDGLRPGQIGTLVDEVANPLDVTATIVDLAVRGYLRIEEIEGEGWFAKPDWTLTKLRAGDDLHPYEVELFVALFESGDEVALSELKDNFAKHLSLVQNALYEDMVNSGWFPVRPDRVRSHWIGIGVLVLVAGLGLTVAAAAFTHLALVPIPIAVVGLLLLAFSGRMPHRTAKGTGVLRRAGGFRVFIEESEAERARFAERAHLFSEYLPYAIVFGVTEKWAKAFAGLDGALPDTSGWYVGHHNVFTALAFSSAINNFTVTTAGTITSTPAAAAGASGFGGGGFSGGGGGGGGGGSW